MKLEFEFKPLVVGSVSKYLKTEPNLTWVMTPVTNLVVSFYINYNKLLAIKGFLAVPMMGKYISEYRASSKETSRPNIPPLIINILAYLSCMEPNHLGCMSRDATVLLPHLTLTGGFSRKHIQI